MKTITLSLFVGLTSLLGFSQNLLQYGGFEAYPVTGQLSATSLNWQSPSSNKARVFLDAAKAHTGDYRSLLPNDYVVLRQRFTATSGTEYTVKFWTLFEMAQGQITDPDDGIYVQIKADTGEGTNGTNFVPNIQVYVDPSTYDIGVVDGLMVPSAWKETSFNFVAPQANLLLYLYKRSRNDDGDGGLNNQCWMDDFSIEVAATASLEDLVQFHFKSYPNPAKDYINLSAAKMINKIEIYNLLGQEVKSIALNKTKGQVNVSSLSKGVYVVKAFIEDAVGSYKFVKE